MNSESVLSCHLIAVENPEGKWIRVWEKRIEEKKIETNAEISSVFNK